MYENLAIIGAFIFVYSMLSKRLSRTPFSGALVFTCFGFLLGPLGLGWLHLHVGQEGLRVLAELTLALVLFTDASNANLSVLKRHLALPQRLLLVGLPLTILLGFGAGVLFFPDLTLLEVAVLATMLAPTDAALGKAVVTNTCVPADIREGLNVESGLNDGICVPILFVFLTLACGAGQADQPFLLALKMIAEEIGIGVVVGLALSGLAVGMLKWAGDRGWAGQSWRQLSIISLAVACFATAQWLGGSGFIASFVGGLLFGGLVRRGKHEFLLTAEGFGDSMALVTWVIFGAAVIHKAVVYFDWRVILYAVLSLTVIRMLPVYLSLVKLKMTPAEKLFAGWFGPRGLASIVFAVIVLEKDLPGGGVMAVTVVATVLLSVIGHGLTAVGLSTALGDQTKNY